MAGYQGGADQTVIAAAKSAYTTPEGYNASPWDYEGYVNGIANLASFVVGKVGAANERASNITGFEEEINKEFWSANNTDYFNDLKGRMSAASKTMNMSLPFTKAYKDAERDWSNGMASLNKIKKDEASLEEIIKRVKECSGPNQSSWNNPMLKSLMEEVNGGTDVVNQSVRFTDEGIVVMGPDGNETLIEDLPSVASKTDGLATTDFINEQGTEAIKLKASGNWNERNKHLMKQSLIAHLDAQPSNIIGSAAFDYEHLTENGDMSFADHLMATSGPFNEAFENWKNSDSGIGASKKVIQETKMILAQQLWDDNELMKDEFADWLTNDVLGYQIGATKVKSTSKTKTETTTVAEDTRGDSDNIKTGNVDNSVDELLKKYSGQTTFKESKKTSIVNSLVSKGFNIKGFGSSRAKRAIADIDKHLKNDRTYDFQKFFEDHFDYVGVTRPLGMMGGTEDWIDARAAWKQIKLAYSNNPLLKDVDKLDLTGQTGGGEDSGRYTTNSAIEAFLKSNAIGEYRPPINVK